MKLGFVCGEYPPVPHGGIGTLVQTLGRALVADGHSVRVIGLYPGLRGVQHESDHGVEVWRLPQARRPFGWIDDRRRLFRKIAEWSGEGRLDLVEVPDWQGWAAYWPTLPVPVVTRLHGSTTYFAAEMNRPVRRSTVHLEGRSLVRSDFWCSVSRYTADKTKALFGLRADAAAILPNPVVAMPATRWADRRPGLVVFSGTLTEKKGVIPLVDAWPEVVARFPDATLCMVGKDGAAPGGGSMTGFLRQRLGESAGARVHFTGHVSRDEVMRRMSEARVAVFPSYAEAFAIAPLEAMSVGCPTIASALGSGPELIDSGGNGLTVDPHDPPAIAQAICRLLSDEPVAAAMGERGRRTIVDRFSLGPLLPKNVAFYDDCVAVFASRRRATRSGRLPLTRAASPVSAPKPATVRHDAR